MSASIGNGNNNIHSPTETKQGAGHDEGCRQEQARRGPLSLNYEEAMTVIASCSNEVIEAVAQIVREHAGGESNDFDEHVASFDAEINRIRRGKGGPK